MIPNGAEVGKYQAKMKIIRISKRFFSYITKLLKSKMRKKKKSLLSKDLSEDLDMTYEIKLWFSISCEYRNKCKLVNKNAWVEMTLNFVYSLHRV